MKRIVLASVAMAAVLGSVGVSRAGDQRIESPPTSLGAADLPRIHSEYAANQARWASEYLGKPFEATMELERIGNILSNSSFNVSFKEKSGGWMSGVRCSDIVSTPFLLALNAGDQVHVSGTITDHSFGSVDLSNCQFSSEAEAKEVAAIKEAADAKEAADKAAWAEAEAISDRLKAARDAKQVVAASGATAVKGSLKGRRRVEYLANGSMQINW